MGKGEMVSVSLFYKKFINPIEVSVPFGITSTQKVLSYINSPEASSYGAELEFRKSLSFLANNEKSQFNNVVLFGNLCYIKSIVSVNDTSVGGESKVAKRAMQGQSPYIINGGIAYSHPTSNLNAFIAINR